MYCLMSTLKYKALFCYFDIIEAIVHNMLQAGPRYVEAGPRYVEAGSSLLKQVHNLLQAKVYNMSPGRAPSRFEYDVYNYISHIICICMYIYIYIIQYVSTYIYIYI